MRNYSTAGTCALVAFVVAPIAVTAASAQDAPRWGGAYLGANLGYMWNGNSGVDSSATPVAGAGPFGVATGLAGVGTYSIPVDNNGFTGGLQLGYNLRVGLGIIVGIETDIQGLTGAHSGETGHSVSRVAGFPAENYSATLTVKKSLDYFGTLRGRVGTEMMPGFLVYGTGGLAYGRTGLTTSATAFNAPGGYAESVTGLGRTSETRLGWTAGAGVEWAFFSRWSAKLEYLYVDLGSVETSMRIVQGNPTPLVWASANSTATTRFDEHIVRIGVNYQLGN